MLQIFGLYRHALVLFSSISDPSGLIHQRYSYALIMFLEFYAVIQFCIQRRYAAS